jgi:hypothetical protein
LAFYSQYFTFSALSPLFNLSTSFSNCCKLFSKLEISRIFLLSFLLSLLKFSLELPF